MWIKVEERRNTSALSLINAAFLSFPFLGSADIPRRCELEPTPRCFSVSSLCIRSLLSFICRAECGRAANRAQRGSAHLVSLPRLRAFRQISGSRDFYLILPRYNPTRRATRIAFRFRVLVANTVRRPTQPFLVAATGWGNAITPHNFG